MAVILIILTYEFNNQVYSYKI